MSETKPKNGDLQKPEICNSMRRPDYMVAPHLIMGEDPKDYQDLFDSLARDVGPGDAIDTLSLCMAVDFAWNAIRMQRLRDVFYKNLALESVAKLNSRLPASGASHPLVRFLLDPNADDLARRWAANEAEAVQEVQAKLSAVGLTNEAVNAQTLMSNVEMFERLDRMIATATARSLSLLRDIERRRSTAKSKPAVEAEAAEYEMVATNVDEKRRTSIP